MTQPSELNDLLTDLLRAWRVEEHQGRGELRASLSGKKARYLAFELAGAEKKPREGRTTIRFDIGDAVHDVIRNHLTQHPEFEVLDEELEVEIPFWDGVTGHVDLRLKNKNTGKTWLVDIKSVDIISYLFTDPKNVKNTRYWAARNYTFDVIDSWRDDPFKRDYLYQMASYQEAMEAIGKEFDAPIILTVSPTGHLAIGYFDETQWETVKDELLDARDIEWENAVESVEKPYDLPLCWEPDGEKPHLVCQYCDFQRNCYDLNLNIERGKPKLSIKGIRSSYPEED